MTDEKTPEAKDAPVNGQPRPEPFRRAPVAWGRPPSTVFRAGPLPYDTTPGQRQAPSATPRPAPAPARAQPVAPHRPSAILSGSMIPQTPPRPVSQTRPVSAPAIQPLAPAPDPDAPRRVVPDPALFADEPDLTVRPLPEPAPEPIPEPASAAPTRAEEVVVLPDVVVAAPRREAPVASREGASGRLPLYAGGAVAVLAVAAAGWWFLNRSPAVTPTPVAPASEAVVAPVEAAPPAPVTTPAVAETPTGTEPPVVAAAAPATTPAPAAAPTRAPAVAPAPVQTRPAPTTAQPAQAQPAPAQTPPPVVVTAPAIPQEPAGPPPTAAVRPSTDPDAPITTRPQPLD